MTWVIANCQTAVMFLLCTFYRWDLGASQHSDKRDKVNKKKLWEKSNSKIAVVHNKKKQISLYLLLKLMRFDFLTPLCLFKVHLHYKSADRKRILPNWKK